MLTRTLLAIILLISFNAIGQNLCSGNLGDNIFTNGSFGSGSANVVSVNQGIAPGYTYTTVGPPSDGEYIITNNTGEWPNLYGTWLAIPDNSNDPDGYMMVVNASFDPGLFYEQTVTGLCENTQYEFSADIINIVRVSASNHLEPNVTFLLDDEVIFNTGNIPQNEQWQSYGFTFTTGIGQTTVKLSLQNNAPGGIGNDLALDNISFRACGPEAVIGTDSPHSICGLESEINLNSNIVGSQFTTPTYQWQQSFDEGLSWQNIEGATDASVAISPLNEGNNYFRFLLANSVANLQNSFCRVNSDNQIHYAVPTSATIIDTLCEGLTYQFDNQNLTESGTYYQTFINSLGCDSLVTLELTVISEPSLSPVLDVQQRLCTEDPLASITVDDVINGNPPYDITLNGDNPSVDYVFDNLSSGDYTLQITDRFGCTYEGISVIDSTIPFQLDLGADVAVILGETVELSPTSNFSIQQYNWQPDSICATQCSNPIWYPTENLQVILTATSELGCESSDSLNIQVEKSRLIAFPSAFTPNEDNQNDVFFPVLSSPNVLALERLQIYNRWGNPIFNRSNANPNLIEHGWDGTLDGKKLPAGIYSYLAEVKFLDGIVLTYQGAVFLLR